MPDVDRRAAEASILPHRMHTIMCSEIWGANSNVAHSVALPGLQGWVYSAPIELGQNGGDIHYLSVCDQGVLGRVALADVSGHGRAVSAVAERLLGLMRRHINRVEQREFLQELSGALYSISGDAAFATALVLGFDSTSGALVFTNAGHPPPLWYRADEGRWNLLREATFAASPVAAGLPLGMNFFENAYTDVVVELGVGDLLICYTDGLSEAVDPAGRQIDADALMDLARALPVESPMAAGATLLALVDGFRRGEPVRDDETLIVLRRPAWR